MTNDIEDIAERAAIRAVKSTLLQLGIDTENPLEAQRDFVLLRELAKLASDAEFRKDIEQIRLWRTRADGIVNKSIMTLVALIIGGMFSAILYSLQNNLPPKH